jgi:hypothetical protein
MLKAAMVLMLLGVAAALPAHGQTTAPRPSAAAAPHAAAPTPPTPAAGQFSAEPAAKAHCPSDTIVWVNLGASKAYHTSADRYYGKTKHGAYMCQKEAEQAGFHAPGHRPSKAAAKSTSAKTPQ